MSVVLDRCMIHADVFNDNDVFRCTHKDKGALHRMDEQAVPIFGDLEKGMFLSWRILLVNSLLASMKSASRYPCSLFSSRNGRRGSFRPSDIEGLEESGDVEKVSSPPHSSDKHRCPANRFPRSRKSGSVRSRGG